MLIYLGRAERRNIEDKILQLNPILEALGNARTKWNENSSRFAKLIQLFYSKVGKVTGARIHVFMLESSRVVALNSANNGGRPTHMSGRVIIYTHNFLFSFEHNRFFADLSHFQSSVLFVVF